MVKLFKHTLRILTHRQNSVFSAASIIMVTVALSRVLGLFRDRLLAARFTPSDLGIYYAAFRLPNMIFELLVMGVLATAFIPVFTDHLDNKGKEAAFKMAASLINVGLVIFVIFSLPVVFFARQISMLLAPGFDGHEITLMASFTQIMILAQVFPLIIGNFFTGILESFRNFIIPSLAPVVYNVGIILGIIFLTPFLGLYAPVIGVVIGAVLFTVIQVPLVLSLGYKHHWSLSLSNPGTREVGKLMLPRTLGLAVSQIDATVDLILSTLLGAASVTVFNFAQHLQQVPIGLFGASIAQATLPSLSSLYAKKNMDEFKNTFLAAFHQILFLVIPISAILIVLRIPMVRLVFGASTLFDWNSTVITGKTLAYFSISLFAQSLIQLLARAFYALHDTKTPVVIGGVSVGLNTVLSLIFVLNLHMDVWSLGLSTSIASIAQIILLTFFLDRKVGSFAKIEFILPAVKIFLSGIVTGVVLYIPMKLLDQLVFDTTKTINLLFLTGIATLAGMSVYLFLSWFLEVPQISVFYKMIKRAKEFRRGVLIDTTQEVVNVQESNV
ncbi:murein biosynthesis integral membrane protein MurJ [Patescibacteria group bacterium]|nr:murein biosynthesis integral membrane protein MurJ [Patescibacteria group bacterium]MCL5797937.1 murein biosynthesis integral membrane protein MurJ [Patescibacteria group bacterium]